MNSSESEPQNLQKPIQNLFKQNFQHKRKKDYICPCGKPYGSYPALYSHIKRKHQGKPPGEIIKPKSVRRRGRPFKYEPLKLRNQNPHKDGAQHLQYYLRRVQQGEIQNQYPLKQFAGPNQQKASLPQIGINDGQILKQGMARNNRIQNSNSANKAGMGMFQYGSKGERNSLQMKNNNVRPQSESYSQYQYKMQEAIRNQYRSRFFPFDNDRVNQNRVHNNEMISGEYRNLINYKQFINQNGNLQNQNIFSNQMFYNQFQFTQDLKRRQYAQKQNLQAFEALYLRPFEINLKQQMQAKFRPISQGLIQFLQPILGQLLNNQQKQYQGQSKQYQNEQILIQPNQQDKLNEINIQSNQNNIHNQVDKNIQANNKIDKNQINQNIIPQNKNKQQQKQNDKSISSKRHNIKQKQNENKQITITNLLKNDHFCQILKWLMSPPQQQSSHRLKQNYIEFSFRSCLVQFLDFIHKFLQTAQHQQILLLLVFFCDHILAVTGSFQLQPQPQIYQMGLYFNSFINEYLPKLLDFMPYLNKFYIFNEYKKKVSQLFMWMSSWQAIQQYYHNKYHRQMNSYQISQQNYKSMIYQRKYQSYIKQASRQNIQAQSIHPAPSQIDELLQAEQKTQQNPQLIIINPINNEIVGEQKEKERDQEYNEMEQNSQSIDQQQRQIEDDVYEMIQRNFEQVLRNDSMVNRQVQGQQDGDIINNSGQNKDRLVVIENEQDRGNK